jgi:hypothetical protein
MKDLFGKKEHAFFSKIVLPNIFGLKILGLLGKS